MMGPGRELLRIGCNPGYGRPQGLPKMRDHVRRMSVIPVDRLSEVGAGGLSKEDAPHSSRLPDKLAVDALPGSSAFGVVVKGRDAAIKLALAESTEPLPQQGCPIARQSGRAAGREMWLGINLHQSICRVQEWQKCSGEGFLRNYLSAVVSLRAVTASVTRVVGFSSLSAPRIAASLCAPPAANTRTGAARTNSSGTDITRWLSG